MNIPNLREWGIEVPVIPPGPCRVIAMGMHKGGTGKSTVAVGLAQVAAIGLRESHPLESQVLRGHMGPTTGTRAFVGALLAEAAKRITTFSRRDRAPLSVGKRRVLLIDMDPQGTAGAMLQTPHPTPGHTMWEVLAGECAVKDALVRVSDHLHLLPASYTLGAVDRRLGPAHEVLLDAHRARLERRAFPSDQLERALHEMLGLKRLVDGLRPDYARIIIDCPHARTTTATAAFLAADEVLGVCGTHPLSAREVNEFIQMVRQARAWNPDLALIGIVLNFFSQSSTRHTAIRSAIEKDVGRLLFTTALPDRMQIAALAERTVTLRTKLTLRQFADLLSELLEREHHAGNRPGSPQGGDPLRAGTAEP